MTASADELTARVLDAWKAAGIEQEHIEQIAPLIRRNSYYHLAPSPEQECWSRLGGEPWLEGGAPEEGRFLCQLALSELPDSPARSRLPEAGFLYFFVHRRGRDKGYVCYRQEAPDSGPTGGTPLLWEARTEVIFPEYESDAFDALELPAEPGNLYMDWEEDFMGDSFTRFAEGNRLLGGWTDEALAIQKTLRSDERESLDVLLSLDPHESPAFRQSALREIPILAQRLYYLVPPEELAQALIRGDLQPICRYGKAP